MCHIRPGRPADALSSALLATAPAPEKSGTFCALLHCVATRDQWKRLDVTIGAN